MCHPTSDSLPRLGNVAYFLAGIVGKSNQVFATVIDLVCDRLARLMSGRGSHQNAT
jgi:hypothetical protein